MYRGTTPTFTFQLPIPGRDITALSVLFHQAGSMRLEKTLSQCTVGERSVTVSLTEAETLALRASTPSPLEIQLRVGVGEARMASQIFAVPVERILKDGAL